MPTFPERGNYINAITIPVSFTIYFNVFLCFSYFTSTVFPTIILNWCGFIFFKSTTKPFAFIITKYPQPETIVDFLRLITDYDSEVVVCMEPLSSIESVRFSLFKRKSYGIANEFLKFYS